MPQVTGTVYHRDGSVAGGRRVSGLAAGPPPVVVGPATTDGRGRFVLSWDAPAATLAELSVDGAVVRLNVRAGEDFSLRLRE